MPVSEPPRRGPGRLFAGDDLRAQLVRGGFGSLALKLASAGLAFALTIVLARALGPTGYGVYAYVFALVSIIAIPAELGLPTLVVRETAGAHADEQWGLMRGVWRWSAAAVGALAGTVALVAGTLAWSLADRFTGEQLATFAWGLLLVPLIALGNLAGAALRGLRNVLQGQLPELVLRPAVFVALSAAALLSGSGRFTADTAMALHVAGAASALAVGAWLLARARPAQVARAPLPEYESQRWLGSALPLALVAGMYLIHQQTDIVVLGLFMGSGDVGAYRVAAQAATFVAFGLQAVNTVVAPQFARLYGARDIARLQWVATFSARVILVLTVPVAGLLVFFGEAVIELVFGAAYAPGYAALGILAIGQLFNAAFGSVGFLLNMTGHERDTARGMAIAVAVNLVLNVALIPRFGLEGAATATALTLALWNLLLWNAVRARLGIDSTALGKRPAAP